MVSAPTGMAVARPARGGHPGKRTARQGCRALQGASGRRRIGMKRRLFAALTCVLLCLAVLPGTASADTGPKPAVTITVVNAPAGEYYLDLLITDPEPDHDNIEVEIGRASCRERV